MFLKLRKVCIMYKKQLNYCNDCNILSVMTLYVLAVNMSYMYKNINQISTEISDLLTLRAEKTEQIFNLHPIFLNSNFYFL